MTVDTINAATGKRKVFMRADNLQRPTRAKPHKNRSLFFPLGWRKLNMQLIFPAMSAMQTETKKIVQFFKAGSSAPLRCMVAVEIVHGIHFSDRGLLPPC